MSHRPGSSVARVTWRPSASSLSVGQPPRECDGWANPFPCAQSLHLRLLPGPPRPSDGPCTGPEASERCGALATDAACGDRSMACGSRRPAASRTGANRASARAIRPSDMRLARTSLPTEARRGRRKAPPSLIRRRIVLCAGTPHPLKPKGYESVARAPASVSLSFTGISVPQLYVLS